MNSFTLTGWENFFSASASAAASLAGLLFVALSVNLTRILKVPGLASRAGETFIPLAVILIISLLALVPGYSIHAFAVHLICVGALAWSISSSIQLNAIRAGHYLKVKHLILRLGLSQPANLSIIVTGLSLFFGFPGGIYWLVPAVMLAFAGAMANAWILTVEILR